MEPVAVPTVMQGLANAVGRGRAAAVGARLVQTNYGTKVKRLTSNEI